MAKRAYKSSSGAKLTRTAPGVIHVAHREYLGDINPTANFAVSGFPLNPGMSATFPWLSQIASSYEEYYFRNLSFHFRSMSSSSVLAAGANTSLGTVILSTEYNAILPLFTTKNQMENHQFAASIKPSQNISHKIQCNPSHTPLNKMFVRNSAPEANSDIRLYDLGKFQIATQGMQGTALATQNWAIGELWVTYDCCLMKPKISDTPLTATDVYHLGDGVTAYGISDVVPFGTASPIDRLPISGSSGFTKLRQGNIISFLPHMDTGYFLIQYDMIGTGAAVAHGGMDGGLFTNLKQVNFWPNNPTTYEFYGPAASSASIQFSYSTVVKITGPSINEQNSAEMVFSFGSAWGGGASLFRAQLTITELTKQIGDLFTLQP